MYPFLPLIIDTASVLFYFPHGSCFSVNTSQFWDFKADQGETQSLQNSFPPQSPPQHRLCTISAQRKYFRPWQWQIVKLSVFSIVSLVSMERCLDISVHLECQAPGDETHTKGGKHRLLVTMLQVNWTLTQTPPRLKTHVTIEVL